MTSSRYSNIGKVSSELPIATWKIKVNNEDVKTSNKFSLNNTQINSETETKRK